MPVVIQPEAYADWFKPLIDPVRPAWRWWPHRQVLVQPPRLDDENRVHQAPNLGQFSPLL